MQTEARKSDTRISIDNLSSICSNQSMIKAAQVAKALSQQAKADFDRLRQIDSDQTKIRAEHLRFLDLDDEKKAKADRLRRTASLVPDHLQNIRQDDHADEFDSYVVKAVDLTLWEAMLAVLEHTGEVQLFDLQHVLDQFGKRVTRGAIESAIKTHPKQFQARTRGRERFVSLKR